MIMWLLHPGVGGLAATAVSLPVSRLTRVPAHGAALSHVDVPRAAAATALRCFCSWLGSAISCFSFVLLHYCCLCARAFPVAGMKIRPLSSLLPCPVSGPCPLPPALSSSELCCSEVVWGSQWSGPRCAVPSIPRSLSWG